MKIIRIDNIKDDTILQRMSYINGVTFLDIDQRKTVIDACNKDVNTLKSWFKIIKINYNDIVIHDNDVSYSVNNTSDLTLSDLSSGEKFLLYLLACKATEQPLIAAGLFERLGSRLEGVATNIIKDYDKLILIYYNAYLPMEIRQFEVEDL